MQSLLTKYKKSEMVPISKGSSLKELVLDGTNEASSEKVFTSTDTKAITSDETKLNSSVDSTKRFEEMVSFYLASNPISNVGGKINELEIAFGTNPKKGRTITKIDYDNIIKQFKSAGFVTKDPDGLHMLRMNNEYYDVRTKKTKMSNIRAELIGIDVIQDYCKTNNLQKILDKPNMVFYGENRIKFTQKTLAQKDNQTMFPVDFEEFNFRCSYKKEHDFSKDSNIGKNIIREWSNQKKIFRYMNRVRFEHISLPIFLDVSIIKSSKKTGKVPIPQYTIQDAGVFENQETYEIELEVDNAKVGLGTSYDTAPKLLTAMRKCIRIVLSGIQGSNYPIAYSEKDNVLLGYMKLLHGKDFEMRRIRANDFCGPSSVTLQIKNLINSNDRSVPTILHNYCVTDKADGIRSLLYIADNGRIYLIDGNMNVAFTGAYTEEKTVLNTLLDGEHIKHDKQGDYIHLFAAFDIYYLQGKSVREYAFDENYDEDYGEKENYRRKLLVNAISFMKPKSIVKSPYTGKPTDNCQFHIKCKQFQFATKNHSIFHACATILSDIEQGIYEYNTDGLIFTPVQTGVASNSVNTAGSLYKPLWEQSFKWKPAEFNTIDFLVRVKKDKNGQDEIHNIFKEGHSFTNIDALKQYKTLILCCGFDKEKHRFINPFESVISDNLPNMQYDNEEKYSPVPFRPTNPYDENACYCNVELKLGEMHTEENEIFGEHMIVEFKYNVHLSGPWKWIPLRVRYDKTAELRNGFPNYGNAYHVANNNWHSIHNPITKEMIMNGTNIPEIEEDDDVYYNRNTAETNTESLRDFHNLYVKKKLILGVSQRKQTLIDYAVGKAGDLPKWIRARLGFVFGIDKSNSNIFDPLDGACARYIKSAKEYTKEYPKALFLQGNSGNNIRSGKAFETEKEKQIARAIFGNGPKDKQLLKDAVYNQYGVAQEGFNISSCQFALHYFFENNVIFHEFLRNLAECTAMGGYFIGTCYDGKTVFKRLESKIKGEGVAIVKNGIKIYEITKMYDETGFPNDELCLSYMIHVFQDSINKTFPEYLVNFDYLVQMLTNYGFVLVKKEEAVQMGLPNGTGLFSTLFSEMENEIEQNPHKKSDYRHAHGMSEDEKWISFMNRYFVFKKTNSVNAEQIYKQFVSRKMLNDLSKQAEDVQDALEIAKEETEKAAKEVKKRKITKLSSKEKVVIETYSPVLDSSEDIVRSSKVPDLETNVVLKPKLVIGEPIKIKVPKPKLVIGEQVKINTKIKK